MKNCFTKKILAYICVFAMSASFLPISAVSAAATVECNVSGATGVTNLGEDTIGLISLDFGENVNPQTISKENISLYIGSTKVSSYEFTSTTSTGVTIDPKYFSTMDAAKNKLNIYPSAQTACSIVIDGVADNDGNEISETISFTTGVILPVSYMPGKMIKNVAEGIVPTPVNSKINVTSRGEIDIVTDGVLYGNGWTGMFTARGEKDSAGTEQAFTENQVIFSLNLGAQYDIAGVAISGAALNAGSNKHFYIGSDNNAGTTSMTDCTELIKKSDVLVGYKNGAHTENEILSNFSISNNKSQYVHFGICKANQKSITLSELMVFAYVDNIMEFESSNVPQDGIFREKTIKLSFGGKIHPDTLSSGIKLWKENSEGAYEEVTEGFSLNINAQNKKAVDIVLDNFLPYEVNYKVEINTNLNKDIPGYPALKAGKEITLKNVQSDDLAVESTVPEDGVLYSKRQIKLDFSEIIELGSAKKNITVSKNDTPLTLNEDYTVSLDTQDESIVYVTLTTIPEASKAENRVYYKVSISSQLNNGEMGYTIFPSTYQGESITFYNEKSEGKVEETIDFAGDTSSVEIASDTPVSVGDDPADEDTDNVLIWSTQNGATEAEKFAVINFSEALDVMEGPVTVEFTAKIPKSFMGVTMVGKDENGDTAEFDTHAGFTNWSWADGPRRGRYSGEASANCEFKINGSTISMANASAGYYSYKFVIDAPAGNVKMYAKTEEATEWTEQFTDKTIELTTETDNISGIRFRKKIGKPAANAGSPEEMITWYIKNIKVSQTTTPAVISQTVADGASDISDELNGISIGFNTAILPGVTKDDVSLFLVERGKETAVSSSLYDVSVNSDNDGIDVTFNGELGMNKEYRLKIKNITADTEEKGVMSGEKVIGFATAKKYELLTPSISTSGQNIVIDGTLRSYHKTSNESYMVMAALVNSEGAFSKIIYKTATVPARTEGFAEPTYNLTFEKPDGFDAADYSVRIYAFNGLKSTKSNCKMITVPLVSE